MPSEETDELSKGKKNKQDLNEIILWYIFLTKQKSHFNDILTFYSPLNLIQEQLFFYY